MALLLLSIRINKFREQKEDFEGYKEKIFLEVGKIISLIQKEEDKKVIFARLGKIVKQLLNSSKTS